MCLSAYEDADVLAAQEVNLSRDWIVMRALCCLIGPTLLAVAPGVTTSCSSGETRPDGVPQSAPVDPRVSSGVYEFGEPGILTSASACNLPLGSERGDVSRARPLVITRTGAHVTHALVEQKYFVSHTPDPELHLPAIEEKARRTGLGFEVEPFRQRPVGKAVERYDIDKAGEIVAVAIARQLGEMKLNVELKLHPSMAEFLGAAGQTDVKVLPDGKLEVLLKAAWAELEVVWRIAGSV